MAFCCHPNFVDASVSIFQILTIAFQEFTLKFSRCWQPTRRPKIQDFMLDTFDPHNVEAMLGPSLG